MKNLFTTGEAADICSLSQQTIIRCFDSGKLRGFRIPGSKFSGIPRESLAVFMRENGIPLIALDHGKRKVLIVDDDKELMELLVDVFSRDPRFDVRTASSGYAAGMVTQQFRPDIILLDYMLPDINGNIVCQTIRKDPEFENTQIVIVSGVIAQDEIDNLLKAGACDFVRKPFQVGELVSKVASILKME